jgi:hypothetical protein
VAHDLGYICTVCDLVYGEENRIVEAVLGKGWCELGDINLLVDKLIYGDEWSVFIQDRAN